MLPFLVNMWELFELFVAEWLQVNLPEKYTLVPQETVHIGKSGEFIVRIDLVINEAETGVPVCVLDTKYKKPERLSDE